MESAINRYDNGPDFARITKLLKDKDGLPVGTASENPILHTIMYQVKYADGYKTAMAENAIANNLLAQLDQYRQHLVLFDKIIDHITDGTKIKEEDSLFHIANENKRSRKTTKVWEVYIQWKYGRLIWNQIKDVKESCPIQLSEYAVQNKISEEPAFAWCTKNVLKKRDLIISKTDIRYWKKTQNYRICIPKTVKEAVQIDKENGDTRWWDVILQ